MYKMIEERLKMKPLDAASKFPDHYILMSMGSMEAVDGEVLSIADSYEAVFSALDALGEVPFWHITEGINLRTGVGGIVVRI